LFIDNYLKNVVVVAIGEREQREVTSTPSRVETRERARAIKNRAIPNVIA
jgi:hypothetical protein